jgi:flagellin
MATINTNVPALAAQSRLRRSYRDLEVSLERLSSGLRINRGADDPAGLIVSENLRSEIAGVRQAIANTQRASNVISTAEGALAEVANLLVDIQDLVVEAANRGALSDDEIRANQLQVDSAVDSITRIANTTTFAGRKLLNGSLDYVTSGIPVSAMPTVHIFQAHFGTRSYIPVEVNVTTSAQHAELQLRASAVPAGGVSLEIEGTEGVATIELGSGMAVSSVVAAVNVVSDATGVSASLLNGVNPNSGIQLVSRGWGTDDFVAVRPLLGTSFPTVDVDGASRDRDHGRDAVGTINGADATLHGQTLEINTSTLDVRLTLSDAFGIGTKSFAITGGGSLFQLGPEVSTNLQVNVGIPSIAASRLGNAAVGYLTEIVSGGDHDLKSDPRGAADIIGTALQEISILRGRMGAFERNTLDTNVNQLQITLENLTSSESSIRDTDFAVETSRLTRAQILVNAGTSVLAIANATPQSVLALLGG